MVPAKMLQHGYNGSEVPPLDYEASALSTTIALHWEAGLIQHAVTVSQVFRV
jgi:hypothetical protein